MIAPLPTEVPAPLLSTALEADWACAWLNLQGELVEPTMSAFEAAVSDAIGLGRRKIVVLTMGLSNLDAAGLESLERAKDMARARGIKLAIRSARGARNPRRRLGSKSRESHPIPAQWWPAIAAAMRRVETAGTLQLHSSD